MADVGGTHARFAICGTEDTTLQRIHTFRCDDHRDLESAIRAFLDDERI
ncbi:MAG: glucokinase [Halobacteriales archaeon]|nr:glucokinase [Halobacteriales archaeon]